MAKCSHCGEGINSTYIREGSKGILCKLGYYCFTCDAYYDLPSEKLYTVNAKTVYSYFNNENRIWPFFLKIKSLGRDLDPGPLPYQGNALPG